MPRLRKVVVVGLDGLDPVITERLHARGDLPHLARLVAEGGYARIATTYPALTPVAWSTVATGTNPGGHGIFDFVRRDPETYRIDFALNRHERRSAFLPPRAVNLRGGTPIWELLSAAGIPSIILRFPCTYPPDRVRGRMLAGMGVPDLRGGLGTSTIYTSDPAEEPRHGEQLVHIQRGGNGVITTHLVGPRGPRDGEDFRVLMTVQPEPARQMVTLRLEGEPGARELRQGVWSDWLRVRFRSGPLQSIYGIVRFHLLRVEPVLELYASPINFDPQAPPFPLSAPPEYAGELDRKIGTFYTTGLVEDHTALNNGRFTEATYLAHCEAVLRERERMMLYELDRLREGLLFVLFDTPDRVQHMFWPPGRGAALPDVVESHYRACDAVVGAALRYADETTLVMVLSDHGMVGFRRGVHLNTWLHDQGFLVLRAGIKPGGEAGELLQSVDWSRTRAYALGLGGIYLNLKGRESHGCVGPPEADAVAGAIAAGLTGLLDPDGGAAPVRSVLDRAALYTGPYASASPDLLVSFADGYRVSWTTAVGGAPEGHFEDNERKWSGDHAVDPALVPGVLFMNHPFAGQNARLLDVGPTILAALGVPKGPVMEGDSLLR